MNKDERMANEGDFKYFKGKISPHLAAYNAYFTLAAYNTYFTVVVGFF